MMCGRMGIDVWEVIEAAATKALRVHAVFPGSGLGGHCIPIDPFYLSWKPKQAGIEARLHRAGRLQSTADAAVRRWTKLHKVALNEHSKSVKGSPTFMFGRGVKKDIDDVRESRSGHHS